VVLEQAWNQGIKPILVLNKIDRLILEKKLEPADAHAHISQVLEQASRVVAPDPIGSGIIYMFGN
jgi:ribosome assembly protein 1